MTQLIFIRHAETALAGRFCGHSDPPVNARGLEQIATLIAAPDLAHFDAVYTSDLQRACITARALSKARAVPLTQLAALREIDFGAWEALSWDEILARDSAGAHRWAEQFPLIPTPGGEAFPQFKQRVLDAVAALRHAPYKHAAVVTHAGVMRVVLEHLAGRTAEEAWAHTKQYCNYFILAPIQPEATS